MHVLVKIFILILFSQFLNVQDISDQDNTININTLKNGNVEVSGEFHNSEDMAFEVKKGLKTQ